MKKVLILLAAAMLTAGGYWYWHLSAGPSVSFRTATVERGNVQVSINATGTLVYSTFLGGLNVDKAVAVALDANNQAYVTGLTDSANFPTTPGAFDTSLNGMEDGFVAKIADDTVHPSNPPVHPQIQGLPRLQTPRLALPPPPGL